MANLVSGGARKREEEHIGIKRRWGRRRKPSTKGEEGIFSSPHVLQ